MFSFLQWFEKIRSILPFLSIPFESNCYNILSQKNLITLYLVLISLLGAILKLFRVTTLPGNLEKQCKTWSLTIKA